MFGRSLWALALMMIVGASARAGTWTSLPSAIPRTDTNWLASLSLPKWNPADYPGQNLTGVSFHLTGEVWGDLGFEHTGNGEADVTMSLVATIKMMDPLNNEVVVVLPTASTFDHVLASDGITDFGGDSGRTHANLYNTATQAGSSLDFALFTGTGNIVMPVLAVASSSGTGSGNLTQSFSADAAASATVTYTYSAVPVPASAWMGGALLAGLGVRKLRKRAA